MVTPAQDMRIQFAEKVAIAAAPGHTEFDAYGRRFSLTLESNDRLIAKLSPARKAALSRHRFLRGKIDGVPDSWIRLSDVGGKLEGAIWDGRDLYAVSRLEDVELHLTVPIAGAPDDVVVYRLSDTINLLPKRFCGVTSATEKAETNGLAQYKSLLSDITAQASAASVAYEQLDVQLVADTSFQTAQSVDIEAAMVARLNTADGIFAAQLALFLNATDVQLVPQGSDPFTQLDPELLLDQVTAYRTAHPPGTPTGITHLVTAKNLQDDVLGIANLNTVCNATNATSLSIGTLANFSSGLIIAHEIAHNLGAVHDGEGACSAVPSIYLMAAEYNGSSRFSQCSIDSIQPRIASAACIGPVAIADVSPTISAPATAQRNVPFTITASLQSTGSLAAQGATLTFTVPSDLFVQSIVPSAGTCVETPQPSCSFGNVAAGEQRTVTLTVRPTMEANQRTVNVVVGATNDRVANNNSAFTTMSIVNNADAELTLSPGLAVVRMDDPVEYTIRVRALRSEITHNIHVSVLPIGLRNLTFTPSAGTCSIFGDCNVGDLSPGSSATITVRGIANSVGQNNQDIRLDSFDDTDGSNNFATFQLTVDPLVNVSVDRPNTELVNIGVGEDTPLQFTVRNSLGTQSASNVTVTLFGDGISPIQTAAVSGGSCVVDSSSGIPQATCNVGTLAAGASRVVTVGIKGAFIGFGTVTARAGADRNDSTSDDEAHIGIAVRHPVDLRLQGGGWVERVEGANIVETVGMYSSSLLAATDFVLTVELGAESHLTSLSMADTVCQLVDARHGRCTVASLPHQTNRTIAIGAVGDSPGSKTVKVAISAATEADASDNLLMFNMPVAPFTDVGITPFTLPEVLILGQSYRFDTHLRTAYRDVSNVMFVVSWPVELEVLQPADLTGCTTSRDPSNRFASLNCPMPLVAANTDRLLTFQVRPLALNLGARMYVQALSNPDYVHGNDGYDQAFRLVENSDLSVDVASGTAGGTAGTTFNLPRITLRSPHDTVNMVVKVPIPAFATVDQVTSSAGWPCTGTTTLECSVYALVPGAEASFDITLRANSAGTFTSKVDVTAANDPNSANNGRDVVITVTAANSGGGSSGGGGSGSSSGGGGGGGRMDWSGLAILGLLAIGRLRRRGARLHPAHATRH